MEEVLPALRRYARALTRDGAAADDLVQETLLRAYEKADTFREGRSLRSWLLSILHNRFVDDERRRDVERRNRGDLVPEDTMAAQVCDPERSLYLRQVADRFARLPHPHRAVLHLVAVEGMTYQQAAETLDLPVGTVMSRLSRAREMLRRAEATAPAASRLRIVGGSDDR